MTSQINPADIAISYWVGHSHFKEAMCLRSGWQAINGQNTEERFSPCQAGKSSGSLEKIHCLNV